MNISALIGKKVIHKTKTKTKTKTLGEGRIIEISNGYITVEFSNKTIKFVLESFDQFFDFKDVETHNIITSEIESIKKEKAEAEVAKKAAEEQKKQAMAAASITMSGSSPKKRIGVGSSSTIITTNMLLSMHPYGTVAQAIYDCCCSAFGWDKTLRGRFGVRSQVKCRKIGHKIHSKISAKEISI